MFGTLARLALLRFMPRRLLPLLAAWQVVQLVRSRRRRRGDPPAVRTDESTRRTHPD